MKSWITPLVLSLFLVAPVRAATFDAMQTGVGFGGAIAASESEAFVGSAPVGWPTGDEPAGTVYRFARDADGLWVEAGRLRASDGRIGDAFGRSIFLHEDLLVVGAPGSGAAYVFERGASGAWTETGKLVPAALKPGAEFAGAVARAGNRTGNIAFLGGRIAVASFDAEANAGSVHLFRNEDGFWQQDTVLAAGDEGFGWTVASGAGRLFVGAPAVEEERGTVVIYAPATDGWIVEQRVSGAEMAARGNLGQTLAFGGGRLYAGAPGAREVRVFEQQDGTWSETGRLQGDGLSGFGQGLKRTMNRLAIAANGAVLVFDADSEMPPDTLRAPDERTEPGFGTGLAVTGTAVFVGSPRSDYNSGLATVFEYDGTWQPVALLTSELEYLPSMTGDQVDCKDGKAGLYDCDQVDLVSMLSLGELVSDRGVQLTDIWGWEDPVTGKEWVLQARTDGTAFVDISDPGHPVYVGQIMRTAGSPGATWRDVKVYRDHAYIVADGSRAHGIQVFDLTRLRDVKPEDMPVLFEETSHYSGVNSTHNIVINEETGFGFAVGNRAGGETCGGQLHMIDLRDPANPTFAGCFSVDGAGGTHDAQCVVYRGADTDYVGREVCFNSNGSSFIIADVTDKTAPATLARVTYPLTAYTHQGWLTEDHNYFYMNDELDEMNEIVSRTRTLVWDVQDLDDPTLVNEIYLDSGASDHNLYVRGRYLYESNYQAGLRILDISDPVNPVEVGHFDTAPFAEDAAGFGGSWSNYPFFRSGIIAVSSQGEGLFLLRKRVVDL